MSWGWMMLMRSILAFCHFELHGCGRNLSYNVIRFLASLEMTIIPLFELHPLPKYNWLPFFQWYAVPYQ